MADGTTDDGVLVSGCVVRRAAVADVAVLAALEAEGRALLPEARGGPEWLVENPPTADWSAAIAAGGVVLALVDGVPVGFLRAEPPDRRGVARVAEVWVHPEARELGFGDLMLERTITWARAGGAVAVEGDALPGDRDTKNLYERAGITARKITVYQRLSP